MKRAFLIVVIMAITCISKAQYIALEDGDLSPLSKEKIINIVYTFDNLTIGKMTETDYIQKKVKEYNNSEQGRGERWLSRWKSDREGYYYPNFEYRFNKYITKRGVKAERNLNSAKYTMYINTSFIEPGFTGWSFASKASEITLNIKICETSTKDKVIANILIKSTGDVSDYSITGCERIAASYRQAGILLGKYFRKNVYQK